MARSWLIEKATGSSVTLGILAPMNASIFGLALFGSMLCTLRFMGPWYPSIKNW